MGVAQMKSGCSSDDSGCSSKLAQVRIGYSSGEKWM